MTVINDSDDSNRYSTITSELDNSTSGNSEGCKKLSTNRDKPTHCFNATHSPTTILGLVGHLMSNLSEGSEMEMKKRGSGVECVLVEVS
ncbi:hypothetical protein L6452_37851 [Arctium lappa]|uniref:Uncharacterized protein n=1 Tax=Arctium lappa TaxID=4217 RepID=A0ACB8Y567_ARCLA|nr:hypothetical protein L6452_37851 [Arctium lappa]